MTLRHKFLLKSSLFLLIGFGWVHAGEEGQAEKVFQALSPLVGKTFLADFPNGAMTDEHIYSSVFDGKFIRDVHYVRNGEGEMVYQGETIFAKDQKMDRVVWWYWNSTGGYLTGTVELKDGQLLILGDNNGPAEQTQKVRSLMADIDEKGYQSTAFFWKNDQWEKQWTMIFKKTTAQK